MFVSERDRSWFGGGYCWRFVFDPPGNEKALDLHEDDLDGDGVLERGSIEMMG